MTDTVAVEPVAQPTVKETEVCAVKEIAEPPAPEVSDEQVTSEMQETEDAAVVEDVQQIDDRWRTGKVVDWKHTYGFVEESETGERHFIHNSDIETADRHVFLRKGMQLRYYPAMRKSTGEKRAIKVQALDGSLLTYFAKQGETDPWSRVVIEPHVTFSGVVNRFFFKRGFGWIRPNNKFRSHDFGDGVSAQLKSDIGQIANVGRLYVAREDIQSADFPPALRQGQKVTFNLYKDKRGVGACNVCNEHGEIFKNTYDKQVNGLKRYTGRVKKIKTHGYLFIKQEPPIVGVKGLRPNEDIHAHCESIQTTARPAHISVGTKVTYSLTEDTNGFHATEIRDEDDQDFETDDNRVNKRRTASIQEIFEGTIDWFRWEIGSGWIRPSVPIPSLVAHRLSNNGLIFFSRDDLISNDKVFGINAGERVRFQLLVDETKGVIGTDDPQVFATNICDIQGRPIEGQKRPEAVQTDRARGHVAYYESRRNVCYIKYQGKRYGVPLQDCTFEDPAQQVYRGLDVEFTVNLHENKKSLSQVVFKQKPFNRRRGRGNGNVNGNVNGNDSRRPDRRAPGNRHFGSQRYSLVDRMGTSAHQSYYHQQPSFGNHPPALRQAPQQDFFYNNYYTGQVQGQGMPGYLNNFHSSHFPPSQ